MARMRSIKPGFFENEELAQCSPWARLLFIGLWCLADREGRLEDRPGRIKAQILPYESQDVDALLEELARHGFILRYTVLCADDCKVGRYIEIPKFLHHQNPHPKEPPTCIPRSGENGCREKPRKAAESRGRGLSGRAAAGSSDPGSSATATDAAETAAAADLVEALRKKGLSHALARRHASETADPALIREILSYHERRLKIGKLDNPIGALRSMLRDPGRWGFEQTEAGWVTPQDSQPAGKKAETEEERRARVKREREVKEAEKAKLKPPTEEDMVLLRKKLKGGM